MAAVQIHAVNEYLYEYAGTYEHQAKPGYREFEI